MPAQGPCLKHESTSAAELAAATADISMAEAPFSQALLYTSPAASSQGAKCSGGSKSGYASQSCTATCSGL